MQLMISDLLYTDPALEGEGDTLEITSSKKRDGAKSSNVLNND